MKSIFIYLGTLAIVLNSIIGIIIPTYSQHKWLTNDVIIIINTILLTIVARSKLKDGFKISFSFLLPSLGFIQLIFGIFLQNKLENNFQLLAILLIFFIQLLFLLLGNLFSKHI